MHFSKLPAVTRIMPQNKNKTQTMKTRQYAITKQKEGEKEELYCFDICFNMFEAKKLFKEQMTKDLIDIGNGIYTDKQTIETWEFSADEKIFKSDTFTFRLKTIRESEKWVTNALKPNEKFLNYQLKKYSIKR